MDKGPVNDEGRVEIVKKVDQVTERANVLKRKVGSCLWAYNAGTKLIWVCSPQLDDLQPSASRPTTLRARLDYLEQNFPGSTTSFKNTKPKRESNGAAASKADKEDAVSNDMQVDEENGIPLPPNE